MTIIFQDWRGQGLIVASKFDLPEPLVKNDLIRDNVDRGLLFPAASWVLFVPFFWPYSKK